MDKALTSGRVLLDGMPAPGEPGQIGYAPQKLAIDPDVPLPTCHCGRAMS